MSTSSKIWIVVIVLLVIAGVWWYVDAGNNSVPVTAPVSSSNVLPTAPSDDSNAALDQDMNSMNMQMNDLGNDAGDVNASVASSTGQ